MTSLAFEVPGPVVPWQRTASVNGRRVTPARQRDYQDRVRWMALKARQEQREPWPLDDAARYRLHLAVYRDARRLDLDNCLKTYGDALNGVLWLDDSQAWTLSAERHVDRENPRTIVCVEVVE